MVDLGKLGDAAKRLAGDDRVQKALRSEQAEKVSDRILDSAAGVANRATGQKHAEKVEELRRKADESIGDR